MQYQFISYLWPLLISASVTLSLGGYALIRQRHSKCAVSFIVSMLIVTVWSGGNVLEMSGTDFSTKLFWANIQYFAYGYSSVRRSWRTWTRSFPGRLPCGSFRDLISKISHSKSTGIFINPPYFFLSDCTFVHCGKNQAGYT